MSRQSERRKGEREATVHVSGHWARNGAMQCMACSFFAGTAISRMHARAFVCVHIHTGGGVEVRAAVAHEEQRHPQRQVAVHAVRQPRPVGEHHALSHLMSAWREVCTYISNNKRRRKRGEAEIHTRKGRVGCKPHVALGDVVASARPHARTAIIKAPAPPARPATLHTPVRRGKRVPRRAGTARAALAGRTTRQTQPRRRWPTTPRAAALPPIWPPARALATAPPSTTRLAAPCTTVRRNNKKTVG